MKTFYAKIEFEVDNTITDEQFYEWFKYDILEWGGCSENNPLYDIDKRKIIKNFNVI